MGKTPDFSRFQPLQPLSTLAYHLLGWYDTVHTNRDMPWRRSRDPYAIWLSETMLQQTQVATVIPYFQRFLARFPTVTDLSQADFQSVLTLWTGLGYYRRAKHLHAAARVIVDQFNGQLPATVPELLQLPGVGRYTAGAVASIAFNRPEPVVDGNVKRVLARLTGFHHDIAHPAHQEFFWQHATEIVRGGGGGGVEHISRQPSKSAKSLPLPQARYGDINQALMELGATICVPAPARPACLLCPVRNFCAAAAQGRQMDLPVKTKKAPVPEVHGIALVITRSNQSREVLLLRRPSGTVWENMWEFPVLAETAQLHLTHLNSKKTQPAALTQIRQWAHAELALNLTTPHYCGQVTHTLTHRRMLYAVLTCTLHTEKPKSKTTPSPTSKLPPCREGGLYQEARWLPWPNTIRGNTEVPIARIVEKIAEAAAESLHGSMSETKTV